MTGGCHVQNIPQIPVYPAGFAEYITLGVLNMIQWIESLITNAAVTAALLAFAAYLLRATISERIRRSIGHEYDEKLEELRTSNTKVLDELRSARAEREAFRAMAMSLMTSTRTSTLDRRVEAIEMLWQSIQDIRTGIPYMIVILDQTGWNLAKIGEQGLKTLESTNYLEALAPNLKSTSNVAKCRPFLGDQLYSLYHAAQAIIGRAISTTIHSYQQKSLRLWFEEDETVALLHAILSPTELSDFNNLKFGKLDWLYRILEGKIVSEIQKELSGEPAAEQALLQAARILERATLVSGGRNEPAA